MMSMGNGGIYEDCHYASFEACRPNVLAGVGTPNAKPRARNRHQARSN
jgi:hypothetical protein